MTGYSKPIMSITQDQVWGNVLRHQSYAQQRTLHQPVCGGDCPLHPGSGAPLREEPQVLSGHEELP